MAGQLAALRAAATLVRDVVLPGRCLACPELVEGGQALCPACWGETTFLAAPVCDRCGAPVPGDGRDRAPVCEDCTRHPPAWDRGRAACLYDGPGRRLALAFKHGDRLDMAPALAAWMARAGAPVLPGRAVVPVPMPRLRLLRRRYNQAAELARPLARRAALVYWPEALRRCRGGATQAGRGREARQAALDGAFAVPARSAARVAGADILLVDDVMTTGATLNAAASALRAAGAAQIDVLVLARVARPL